MQVTWLDALDGAQPVGIMDPNFLLFVNQYTGNKAPQKCAVTGIMDPVQIDITK